MSCVQSSLQNDPQQLRVIPSLSSTSCAAVALDTAECCWGTARAGSKILYVAMTRKTDARLYMLKKSLHVANLMISVMQIMIFQYSGLSALPKLPRKSSKCSGSCSVSRVMFLDAYQAHHWILGVGDFKQVFHHVLVADRTVGAWKSLPLIKNATTGGVTC